MLCKRKSPRKGAFFCGQVGREDGRRPFPRPTFQPPQRLSPPIGSASPFPDKEAPPPQGGLGVGPDKPKKGQPLGHVGGPMRWREREPTKWPARWPLWMPRPEISSRAHFWEPQKKGGRRPPLPVGPRPGGRSPEGVHQLFLYYQDDPRPDHPRNGPRIPGNRPRRADPSSRKGSSPGPGPGPRSGQHRGEAAGPCGWADELARAGADELAHPLARVAKPWCWLVWLRLAVGRCNRPPAIVQPDQSGGGRGRGRGYRRRNSLFCRDHSISDRHILTHYQSHPCPFRHRAGSLAAQRGTGSTPAPLCECSIIRPVPAKRKGKPKRLPVSVLA